MIYRNNSRIVIKSPQVSFLLAVTFRPHKLLSRNDPHINENLVLLGYKGVKGKVGTARTEGERLKLALQNIYIYFRFFCLRLFFSILNKKKVKNKSTFSFLASPFSPSLPVSNFIKNSRLIVKNYFNNQLLKNKSGERYKGGSKEEKVLFFFIKKDCLRSSRGGGSGVKGRVEKRSYSTARIVSKEPQNKTYEIKFNQ